MQQCYLNVIAQTAVRSCLGVNSSGKDAQSNGQLRPDNFGIDQELVRTGLSSVQCFGSGLSGRETCRRRHDRIRIVRYFNSESGTQKAFDDCSRICGELIQTHTDAGPSLVWRLKIVNEAEQRSPLVPIEPDPRLKAFPLYAFTQGICSHQQVRQLAFVRFNHC